MRAIIKIIGVRKNLYYFRLILIKKVVKKSFFTHTVIKYMMLVAVKGMLVTL